MEIKVDAVVVTYNRLTLLKKCLNALLNQKYNINKIFVINNNSTDGTRNYLDTIIKKYNAIIPIHLKKNIGGAGGFNKGIKEFIKNDNANFVWVMDDDTIPNLDALTKLVEKVKKIPDVGYLASNVKWKNGTPALMNIPKPSLVWNKNIEKGIVSIIYASFVSILISRKAIEKVGYPITDFFIWGDDVEYTSRISKAKFKSYLVCDSVVEHKIKNNIATDIILEKDKNRIKRYFYANRNTLYNKKKYSTKMDLMNTFIRQFVLDPIKIICFSSNNKMLRLKANIKGNIAGLFFNPKIEKIREK
ncbi:glycosyltransferase family 2 protein [Lactobacillus helveticus]|uniref:dTDP-rhamnosyl transferase RfbF n=1 Tax=Lactobacillus helveticus CIRM-BIA 953 TaxID=1226335 RepID=U4QES6_LACHE|nr:glycosyltransferase family 2 protein [Lactobacillus helveticus]NRN87630.1 Poly-beta-1,6-N-acetyl-D-glucosamine synthase [Lactobacillus helveticus]CDI43042.1 dTDP-rhamnosyl transferase RfbF [Lactobacillus helveticus CIRM-BIA 953]